MFQTLLALSYEYYATFKIPYANVSQGLYVAYDEKNDREKISFFDDSDYTVWNGKDDEGRYKFSEIITYFNNTLNASAQECVYEPTYTGFDNTELMEMLPDLSSDDFKRLEDVTFFGQTYSHYERHIIDTPGGDIPVAAQDPDFNFTYVRDDYEDYYCEQQGDFCVPFKWEFSGKNTLFGSHYDLYVLEVHQFTLDPVFNDSTFTVTMKCTESPIIVNGTHLNGQLIQLERLINPANRNVEKVQQLSGQPRFSGYSRKELNKVFTGYNRRNAAFEFKHNLTNTMFWPEMTAKYYIDEKGRKIAFPKNIDWRTKNSVTGVRDECSCGSCWSFGTAAAIESRLNILLEDSARPLSQISEQAIVDCIWATESTPGAGDGLSGCDGGMADEAIEWMIEKYGGKLPVLDDYPYEGQNMACEKDKWSFDKALLKGFFNTQPGNDNELKYALLSGPVTIAIAVPDSMFAYAGGIYDPEDCYGVTYDDLGHQVTLVGYDTTTEGEEYWIVKNSWSNLWGADGYIYIKFGYCGVNLAVTGAVLEKPE